MICGRPPSLPQVDRKETSGFISFVQLPMAPRATLTQSMIVFEFVIPIAASARDATSYMSRPSMQSHYFNPRIPYGVRQFAVQAPLLSSDHFNPRIRMGCDAPDDNRRHRTVISIHASAEDATANFTHKRPYISIYMVKFAASR